MEMLFYTHLKARSSGGERYLDTVEVPGSKPGGPTIFFRNLPAFSSHRFRYRFILMFLRYEYPDSQEQPEQKTGPELKEKTV